MKYLKYTHVVTLGPFIFNLNLVDVIFFYWMHLKTLFIVYWGWLDSLLLSVSFKSAGEHVYDNCKGKDWQTMDHRFSLGILLRNLNETLRRKMLMENMLVSFRILRKNHAVLIWKHSVKSLDCYLGQKPKKKPQHFNILQLFLTPIRLFYLRATLFSFVRLDLVWSLHFILSTFKIFVI